MAVATKSSTLTCDSKLHMTVKAARLPSILAEWDIFISYSSEDKQDFVRPLADLLAAAGLRVWFDEFMLTIGDSLRRSIDYGLVNSNFGVIILSPSFFAKEWPKKELDGLVAREQDQKKVILPVWHKVTKEDVERFSPILADRLAISSSRGVKSVAIEIVRAVRTAPLPRSSKEQIGSVDFHPTYRARKVKIIPKAFRTGLELRILSATPDRSYLSIIYIEKLCDQAYQLLHGVTSKNCASRLTEVLTGAMLRAKIPEVTVNGDDFMYFMDSLNNLSLDYIFHLEQQINSLVLKRSDEIAPHPQLQKEFIDMIVARVRTKRNMYPIVIDCCKKLVRERLERYAPKHLDHEYLLALFLFFILDESQFLAAIRLVLNKSKATAKE